MFSCNDYAQIFGTELLVSWWRQVAKARCAHGRVHLLSLGTVSLITSLLGHRNCSSSRRKKEKATLFLPRNFWHDFLLDLFLRARYRHVQRHTQEDLLLDV